MASTSASAPASEHLIIAIDPELKADFKQAAEAEGRPMSALLRLLIHSYLKVHKGRPPALHDLAAEAVAATNTEAGGQC